MVSILAGYSEGMGHLALQRVWHSPQSAGESPFSGEPVGAKAINVTASFRRICDRIGSICSVHRQLPVYFIWL